MAKKEKEIKSITISLHGGPLNGKEMEVAYPTWGSYVLNMGRSLYVKRTFTDFDYTEDWSLRTTPVHFGE
jgi:hypothetical protein